MPQNYAGRVTLIVVVLLIGLFGIPYLTGGVFQFRPFAGGPDEKTKQLDLVSLNLKPGIDIAGGTSLLYEIKPPAGGVRRGTGSLAEEVAKLLKKRIDPTGTRNLIWRPTGDTRLEIQIPRASMKRGEGTPAVKAEYAKLRDEIEQMNIRAADVTAAVETKTGPERDKALAGFAHGLTSRTELFDRMKVRWDRLKAIEAERVELRKAAKPDEVKAKLDQLVDEKVGLQREYDKDKAAIEQTNLVLENVQSLADAANPAPPAPEATVPGQPAPVRDVEADKAKQDAAAKELAALQAKYPDRKSQIERVAQLYPKFLATRGSIDDAADLKRQLRGSGVLEFHIMVDRPEIEQPKMLDRLRQGGDGPSPQAGDESRWFEVDRGSEFRGAFPWRDKFYSLAWTTPERSMTHSAEGGRDWGLESAKVGRDQNSKPIVEFEFEAVGGQLFSRLTSANLQRRLATILDNKIITAPNIQSTIGSRGQISLSGEDGEREGLYIANTLSAGSLPAQLADEPISERDVGPQLGKENLEAGLRACAVGLVVVALFMIIYYHLSGVVAFVAVVFNLIIILGVLGMMGATFTLPGIAALVLTIGMSVDANVLIFERLREEQMRGLSLKLALRNAYDRAFTAILDSNVTTAITSAFLIYFGSEEVKGFGLTLLIGIISSMFCALFVTKTIFAIMINNGLRKLGSLPLSFPRWNQLMHPRIDWMAKVKYFLAFSIVFLAVGLIAFVRETRAGRMLDVEFTSGTEVQVSTKTPVTDKEVRERIANVADRIPQPTIVAIGDEDGNSGRYKSFSIVTANNKRKDVTDAVAQALGDLLNVAVQSRFAGDAAPPAAALDAGTVQPIIPKHNELKIKDYPPVQDVSTYSGGVAIVLEDLNPPLTPREITDRVNSVVLRAGADTTLTTPTVARLGAGGAQEPTRSAVVMFYNKNLEFAKNDADWRGKLAIPAWQAVTEGIGRPPTLEKVSNFDAQIAGDTQKAALFATLGSIVAIMVWIWLRFGDHKYGTATVAAMIHDTVMVIGAIGVSHWFAGSMFGNALALEAFRVNMTLVAAILTVMGYSMVDTIVVFDRIRENRGKYGVLSRQLVNDSINQTLSRTLLTAGTTMMTLFVMYVWGGPAIHGFTFVLLIGILIGTYSSIAIGAPILLIGGPSPVIAPRSASSGRTSGTASGIARV